MKKSTMLSKISWQLPGFRKCLPKWHNHQDIFVKRVLSLVAIIKASLRFLVSQSSWILKED
jgi:isopenicillin N synthase-like dioxygenase